MGLLDFIFGVIALFVVAFLVIGTVCMHYDNKQLEQENEKLKKKLDKKTGGKK